MKKLSIALVLALAALSGVGVGTVWADNAGQTVQAP